MKRMTGVLCAFLLGAVCAVATADINHDYEDLDEGFLGQTYHHDGVTYHDVNEVSGVWPNGDTFEPDGYNVELIIERATYFYDEFPDYGSPVNSMTFGSTYVPGDNLSLGALASVWMDLDEIGDSASLDIGYYENGPWGGIVYRLDGLLDGNVVTTDSFTISDLGGRDNPTFSSLSISGAEFDQLHLYATFVDQYSMPRGIIDDLSISIVPEPASLTLLAAGFLALRRR